MTGHPHTARPAATFGLSYSVLANLCDHRLGMRDVACPLCGPDRRTSANRKRLVLRIWHCEPGFATYACARCGERGWARDGQEISGGRRQSSLATQLGVATAQRIELALRIWHQTMPLKDTLGWKYFTEQRGLHIGALDVDHALRWSLNK